MENIKLDDIGNFLEINIDYINNTITKMTNRRLANLSDNNYYIDNDNRNRYMLTYNAVNSFSMYYITFNVNGEIKHITDYVIFDDVELFLKRLYHTWILLK
jgi:hypothetical protein